MGNYGFILSGRLRYLLPRGQLMKVLCLVAGEVIPPDRWMWNHLPAEAQGDQVDFIGTSPPDLFPKWGKIIAYYPYFMLQALKAVLRCQKERYDAVLAWEAKTGLSLAFVRSLFGIRKPKLVILAFIYKGIGMYFLRFGRWLARNIQHVVVQSTREVQYYQELLGFSAGQVTFNPLGGFDLAPGKPAAAQSAGEAYIFSGGRTDRDYSTLFGAVSGLGVRVIVNARKFNTHGLILPTNVTVNDLLPKEIYQEMIQNAALVVVPLQARPHACGLIAILQAMALGKAVIATRTSCVCDYIEDGKTGLLVEPENPTALRAAILRLLGDPTLAGRLGAAARRKYSQCHTAEAFAMGNYQVLKGVVLERFRRY